MCAEFKDVQPSTSQQASQNIIIFVANMHKDIGVTLAKYGGFEVGDYTKSQDELKILLRLKHRVQGRYVYVISSGHGDTYAHMIELGAFVKNCKDEGAKRVVAIIPYLPQAYLFTRNLFTVYDLVVTLITSYKVDLIMTVGQTAEGTKIYRDLPFMNLNCDSLFVFWIKNCIPDHNRCLVVSPTYGKNTSVLATASALQCKAATLFSEHNLDGHPMSVVGDLTNRDVIQLVDNADYRGNLRHTTETFFSMGARNVYVMATHGVVSVQARVRIRHSCMDKIVTTNTVPLSKTDTELSKLEYVDITCLLMEAIIADQFNTMMQDHNHNRGRYFYR